MNRKTRKARKMYLLITFGLDGGQDDLLGGVLLGSRGHGGRGGRAVQLPWKGLSAAVFHEAHLFTLL